MAEFDATHRDLDKFLAALEKRKEGGNDGGSKDEAQELDSGGEQVVRKKENISSKRESQRLSTAAIGKLATASK